MHFIEITDHKDPRIEEFCDIRERDLVRGSGQFIAEGKVVLQHLIAASQRRSKFQLSKLLILKNRLDGLSDVLKDIPSEIPIYTAERDIMDQIAGFPVHRGVLGLGQVDAESEDGAWIEQLPDRSLVLIASEIANHDNIGSIFRNASAFGVSHILLDKKCCHPLYRKAIRVSVGSALTMPYSIHEDLDSTILKLTQSGFQIFGLTPADAVDIQEIEFPKRIAIMVGAEGEGLDRHFLDKVRNVRIPQSQQLDSLNVSTATGIALWYVASQLKLI